MTETLAENFYKTKINKPNTQQQNRPKTAGKVHRVPVSVERYDRRLAQMKNVQGGGHLVNGRTFDFRRVIEEIVKGYPMV